MNVGRHEATIQLRLAAATLAERYALEEKLVDLFLRSPMRPGVLLTTVTAAAEYGDFLAAWEFDEDEWNDEKAFDSQFWAVATLTGVIPALVTRVGTYELKELRLGLTGDFKTAYTAASFDTSPATVEVVRINQDGTLSKVT